MSDKQIVKKIIKMFPFGTKRLYSFLRISVLPLIEIEKLLPKKGNVLDVGCGYGITSAFFAIKNPDVQIDGSEINKSRVKTAKNIFSGIHNLNFYVSSLIKKNNKKYDAIIAVDLLHHLDDSQKNILISDAYSSLSNNGLFIIKDINTRPILKYLWNYLHDLLMTKFSKLYFLSHTQTVSLLQKNKFKIVKKGIIKNILYPHYFYVCKKIK